MNLDFIQKEIVESDKDKTVVLASAGSGKTKVLIDRINYLIDNGFDPSEIYAITFTNAAADEMKIRLKSDKVFVGTIHSLANQILIANDFDTSDIIAREAYDELLEIFFNTDKYDYIYDIQ
jgi:DNA helicase-2/ATP-dependent DNA helicase PcrA